MNKYFLSAAAGLSCAFAAVSVASAQTATFSFDDHNGTPNAGSYAPGSSFTFSINLAFTAGGSVVNLVGYSYWFEQANPNAPFNFAITNRDVTGSQFTFLQTPSIVYPQNLTPQNSSDLGAETQSGTGLGNGTYFVADLTFSIAANAAPGTYVIENTTTGGKTSVISDDQGHTLAIPKATYTITVVPEPSSVALFIAGLMLLGAFFYRRIAFTP